jgi:hypothetical protein
MYHTSGQNIQILGYLGFTNFFRFGWYDQNMKIFLDGLERSGNVFLSYAIGMSMNASVISKRTHELSTLKEYEGSDIFVVPVRDAVPSIASATVYRNKFYSRDVDDVEKVALQFKNKIKRYEEYTDYLIDNPKFFIAPFHEFTKDHQKVLEIISKEYPSVKIEKTFTYDEIKKNAELGNKAENYTEYGHFPRATPEKDRIEEVLRSVYGAEMLSLQGNIDKLYQRYYDIVVKHAIIIL